MRFRTVATQLLQAILAHPSQRNESWWCLCPMRGVRPRLPVRRIPRDRPPPEIAPILSCRPFPLPCATHSHAVYPC